MGNTVFGVKWRDWKLLFKEQDSPFSEVREYTSPRVYNLLNDPREGDNVLFPNTGSESGVASPGEACGVAAGESAGPDRAARSLPAAQVTAGLGIVGIGRNNECPLWVKSEPR